MPSIERAFRDSVKKYVKEGQVQGLEKWTIYERERIPNRFRYFQTKRGGPVLPDRVAREDVAAFRDSLLTDDSDWNARHSVSFVNGWLQSNGNPNACLRGVRWNTSAGTVTRGRWLSAEEKVLVERSASTVFDRWIVHCGFRLCMRQREWLHLRVEDVDFGRRILRVRGKGRKRRDIGFLADTERLIRDVLGERAELVSRHARLKSPPDPTLLLVRFNRRLKFPSESWADNVVRRVSEGAGIPFRSHDMRRTGARHYYLAGVPLVQLQRFLGHTKPETTLVYVGALFEETTDAIREAERIEVERLRAVP